MSTSRMLLVVLMVLKTANCVNKCTVYLTRGLNSPFRITENVEILNIICCRQKSEILSTVVLLKNLKIYLLKLFINKSRHFYLVKCVY